MRRSHGRYRKPIAGNRGLGRLLRVIRARVERREAETRFRSLMANVPGVVFQWSRGPDGEIRIPFVSDSAATITGLSADEIVDNPRRLLGRIPRRDRIRLVESLQRSIRTLEPVTEDFVIERGAGGACWLRVISRPRKRTGRGILSDAVGLDITDRKVAEMTLQRSQGALNEKLTELHRTRARMESQSAMLMETARQLTEARDSAEQASRAKSNFLSNMSHELRTPLNAILGFSQMIREQTFGPVGSPKYRDYASNIHESGLHLLELINDVLDFAKVEAGKEQIRDEAIDVPEVIDSVLRMVEERAARAELTIEPRIPERLPRILADRRKIKQVLLNLLSNAIKFTGRGGTVTVNTWCSEGSGFIVQVADTGIGIALADIPTALGLFGQVDSAFNRRHEGTGLGLPLSKALVELHGGSLDLQSQPGVGTTVTIRLPAERIVRDPTATARAG
jgi:PAS domain S-box-containing protein